MFDCPRYAWATRPSTAPGYSELLVRDVDTLTSKPQSGLPYDAESAASVRMSPGISGVFRVESVAEAEDLARHLVDPRRTQPVVLVTAAAGQPAPYLDMAGLSENLQGLAELGEMPTGPISWAFSKQLPELCDVYGGAARVYPPGAEWTQNPYSSPLRFLYGPSDGQAAIEQLTIDVMRTVPVGGSFGTPVQRSVAVQGTVLGMMAQPRACHAYAVGRPGSGSVWTDLVAPGVDEDRVLTKGMTVAGTLDLDSRRIDVSPMRVPALEALAGYRVGSVVLAQTRSVERALCVVELFPDFPVSIEPDGVVARLGRLTCVRSISQDEVLVTRVLARGCVARRLAAVASRRQSGRHPCRRHPAS